MKTYGHEFFKLVKSSDLYYSVLKVSCNRASAPSLEHILVTIKATLIFTPCPCLLQLVGHRKTSVKEMSRSDHFGKMTVGQ